MVRRSTTAAPAAALRNAREDSVSHVRFLFGTSLINIRVIMYSGVQVQLLLVQLYDHTVVCTLCLASDNAPDCLMKRTLTAMLRGT